MLLRTVFLIIVFSCSGLAYGTGELALMPGQVIKGHAKLEEKCGECHVRFNQNAQSGLCRDCHKDVKADIQKHEGFHGRLDDNKECRECHTDHKGRNANIIILDPNKFDHSKTDFPLLGAHLKKEKVKCKDCHDAKKKYREAPSGCVDCHRKDDKHKGSLGSGCKNCHNERNWKDTRFDHSFEKTRFALIGKHIDVKCSKCHVSQSKYKGVSHECVACHRKDDKHKGKYGKKCETCHTAKDWKRIEFDHDTQTKFKLLGKHETVKCVACHKAPLYGKEKTPTTCIACHRKDDVHKGGLGTKCETCHTEKKWKTSKFDHDKDTKFPLLGKHITTKCDACHTPDLKAKKVKLATTCIGCHLKKDVHKAKLGKRCETCHNENDWKKAKFDHGRARFPLLGMHIKVDCKKCHQTQIYVDTPGDCFACHKKDDDKVHKLRLGKNCASCHNARSWKTWDFNHDTRTKFKLDGAHQKISCYSCHKVIMDERVIVPRTCDGCHNNDDVHRGEFGQLCDRCHLTTKWKNLRPGISGKSR
jgi:hypothetical protein